MLIHFTLPLNMDNDDNRNFNEMILENVGGLALNSLTEIIRTDGDGRNPNNVSSYFTNDSFIEHLRKNSTNFNIISLNIQSINAKYEQLFNFQQCLIDDNIELSAICLQETWTDQNTDLSLFNLTNYQLISQSKSVSLHGGLMIYLHTRYNYNIMDISINSDIWEGQIIDIPATSHNKRYHSY